METNDPDDFLTLLLLLDHPAVELKAVTVMPGSTAQIGLVRRAIEWFGRKDVAVGAFNLDHEKPSVSPWHFAAYGTPPPSRDAMPATELLLQMLDAETTLITGAPNKNLGAALTLADERGTQLKLKNWVAQGGFAGEGVVPLERQLAKFAGKKTCPSFNLNGAPKVVLRAVKEPGIALRRFVSKNVCHGVIYEHAMHERFAAARTRRQSIELIWKGMDHYLSRTPSGKAFHDPLAACCAIDTSIGQWAEVEIVREHGEWGSTISPGSGTWIIVDYSPDKFVDTLLAA
jgi:pyrimidine-specific ribonucleoside hydrolase